MQPSYLLLIESQGGLSRTSEFKSPRVVIGRDAGDIVLAERRASRLAGPTSLKKNDEPRSLSGLMA